MDDTREVAQNREEDVDEEITAASALEEDTKRREDDGNWCWCQQEHAGPQRHRYSRMILQMSL